MKTGLKIFLFAVIGILVGICVVLGVSVSKSGKEIAETGSSQIKSTAKNKSNLLKINYNDNKLSGNELVKLITDTIEDEEELAIFVITNNGSSSSYNYNYDPSTNTISKADADMTVATSKTDYKYINREALFKCTAKSDKNDNVICIWFEQEK